MQVVGLPCSRRVWPGQRERTVTARSTWRSAAPGPKNGSGGFRAVVTRHPRVGRRSDPVRWIATERCALLTMTERSPEKCRLRLEPLEHGLGRPAGAKTTAGEMPRAESWLAGHRVNSEAAAARSWASGWP